MARPERLGAGSAKVDGHGGRRTARKFAGVLAVLLLVGVLVATLVAGARLWWVSLRGPDNAAAGASTSTAPPARVDGPSTQAAVAPSDPQSSVQAQPASRGAGAAPPPTRSIRLAWDRSHDSGVTGYRILWGTRPGHYSDSLGVGNQTTATLTGLQSGTRYYIVAVAVDASGNQSPPSNELEVVTPVD